MLSSISIGNAQADIINMTYEGLFTFLTQDGAALSNTSAPYYYDLTWRYGKRTQISGSISLNTDTGTGSINVNPFAFLNAGSPTITNFDFKSSGVNNPNLLLANMNFDWNGNNSTTQIVLDASGLFAELPTMAIDDVYDATTCAASNACATPGSNDVDRGRIPIGPAVIATSTFNIAGANGLGTTLGQLSLGIDDSIGGSPNDNGVFSAANYNFDFTSITVVPVPAAVWLFGSGLLGLARCRSKQ